MKNKIYIKARVDRKRKSAEIYRSGSTFELVALICTIIEVIAKGVNVPPAELAQTVADVVSNANTEGDESNGVL